MHGAGPDSPRGCKLLHCAAHGNNPVPPHVSPPFTCSTLNQREISMKKTLTVAVIGLPTLFASGSVLAQGKPEVPVKQRQAAMTLIGKYFGPMGGMASGKVPYNADVVKRNAGYLDALSK